MSRADIGDKDKGKKLGKSEQFSIFLNEGRLVCKYAEIWVKICMDVFNLAL